MANFLSIFRCKWLIFLAIFRCKWLILKNRLVHEANKFTNCFGLGVQKLFWSQEFVLVVSWQCTGGVLAVVHRGFARGLEHTGAVRRNDSHHECTTGRPIGYSTHVIYTEQRHFNRCETLGYPAAVSQFGAKEQISARFRGKIHIKFSVKSSLFSRDQA